jgi:1,4-dihydroxy-2-naphthoyl-CoA hydrolase
MSIWFRQSVTLEQIQALGKGTMTEYIGIEFTELGENYLKARMPVDQRTVQDYGILHGGASATLAETVGSIASAMVLNPETHYCVGLEINANHVRSVRAGYVTAVATPLHLGASTHIWDIRILNDQEKLVCISRLTTAIIPRQRQ